MANAILDGLRAKSDAAFENVSAQLQGMDAHLDRADGPGEWTAREVICHLLGDASFDVTAFLASFARSDYPTVDLQPGQLHVTAERRGMSLKQLTDGLRAQRGQVFAYLSGLPEADLGARKLRIPLFKQFMATDEVSLAMFVGAMFDFHWNDHAGQLAKIRKAAGLPEAK
jgi:hypothetical protein